MTNGAAGNCNFKYVTQLSTGKILSASAVPLGGLHEFTRGELLLYSGGRADIAAKNCSLWPSGDSFSGFGELSLYQPVLAGKNQRAFSFGIV